MNNTPKITPQSPQSVEKKLLVTQTPNNEKLDASVFDADEFEITPGNNSERMTVISNGENNFSKSIAPPRYPLNKQIAEFFKNLGRHVIFLLNQSSEKIFRDDLRLSEFSTDKIAAPLELKVTHHKDHGVEVIGRALGITGEIRSITPKDASLFDKEMGPRISDIKQNPMIQNCWLLAGIAAKLRTHGPESIKNMMVDNLDGTVKVTFLNGQAHIVPIADLTDETGDPSRYHSHSALWVRVLERATMQEIVRMQVEKKEWEVGVVVKADFFPISRSFPLFFKNEPDLLNASTPSRNKPKEIQAALTPDINGMRKAVQLGHTKSSNFFKAAYSLLRNSVMEDHSVSVVDYDKDNGKIIIFDPYQTYFRNGSGLRAISIADLGEYDVYIER